MTKTSERRKTPPELPTQPLDDPSRLAWALWYATEKKWPVFPCIENGKTPITEHGCLDATTDPAEIKHLWTLRPNANIGLHVGAAGMMCYDFDPGSKQVELAEAIGETAVTHLVSRTPRGGEHLYYKLLDDEIVAPSTSKVAPHVDVRSFHSYTLLPPSHTKDGEYTWIEQGEPAQATDEMIRTANIGNRGKSEDRDEWIIEADLPQNIEAAIDWLENKAEIAIEGQGGDQRTYATAAMMKSYGISQEKAFDLMWDHWNERCKGPWQSDGLLLKIENAYAYNTSPPGNMTATYNAEKNKKLFQPCPKPRLIWNDGECVDWEEWRSPTEKELAELEREREKALIPPSLIERMQAALGGDIGSLPAIPLYDLDELASLPSPEWDMEGLIGRAKTGMIVGKWGHGKTFVALDIGIALAGEVPWPAIADKACKQYAVPKPRRVLYIAAEGGAAEYHQRLQAALRNRKEIDRNQVKRNFALATASAPLDTTIGQKAIADVIERATERLGGPPEDIFCDTLAKSMTGEENSNTDMGKVQCVAAAIQRHLDCTFIFVHHTGKDGNKDGRGASALPAGLDFSIHVTGDEETKVVTVNVEKQKDALAEKNIILQGRVVGNSLAFARIGKAPSKRGDQEATALMDRLGQIIEDGGSREFSTQGLAKTLAEEANNDFGNMRKAEQKGEIEKTRGLIRRNITDAKSPEAKDFRERYRVGTGAKAKWAYKDAADD